MSEGRNIRKRCGDLGMHFPNINLFPDKSFSILLLLITYHIKVLTSATTEKTSLLSPYNDIELSHPYYLIATS